MNRLIASALIVLVCSANAHAQQTLSPSQLALQIDNAVNGLAQQVDQLQLALAAAQARVKELEVENEKLKAAK